MDQVKIKSLNIKLHKFFKYH